MKILQEICQGLKPVAQPKRWGLIPKNGRPAGFGNHIDEGALISPLKLLGNCSSPLWPNIWWPSRYDLCRYRNVCSYVKYVTRPRTASAPFSYCVRYGSTMTSAENQGRESARSLCSVKLTICTVLRPHNASPSLSPSSREKGIRPKGRQAHRPWRSASSNLLSKDLPVGHCYPSRHVYACPI